MVNCRPMTVLMLDNDAEKDFYLDNIDLATQQIGEDYEIIEYNRNPHAGEIERCSSHIEELINETHPSGIVLLGSVAKQYKKKTTLPTLDLLHPAFILRKELKLLTIKKQARKLEKFLERIGGIE